MNVRGWECCTLVMVFLPEEPICNCADGPSLCIMAAISGSIQPTMWSQCSIDELNNGFNSVFPLNRCLTNEPSMTVGDPVCGNGVREGEEVCDCGNAEVRCLSSTPLTLPPPSSIPQSCIIFHAGNSEQANTSTVLRL